MVEIKGYRREDAKEQTATMDTYGVPVVNNLRTLGHWAVAELIVRAGGTPPDISA